MTAFDLNIFIIFLAIIVTTFDGWSIIIRGSLVLAICAVVAAIPTLILHALVAVIR